MYWLLVMALLGEGSWEGALVLLCFQGQQMALLCDLCVYLMVPLVCGRIVLYPQG